MLVSDGRRSTASVCIDVADVPPLRPACQMTVTIPARNEQETIADALEALARQQDPQSFDVLVYANNCSDATVDRIQAVQRGFGHLHVHVIEGSLPAAVAHVGYARKLLMDCAANRFLHAGAPRGIVATTDADTIVDSHWVRSTIQEMRSVDAVAGHVEIAEADQQAMPEPLRALYACERTYRHLCTELESLVDPQPEDPFPRHGAFVAASFAVTADVYVRAGRLPPIAALEDREFLRALRRVDAKIRHSLAVRALTSGRRTSRVRGGFSTFMAHLANCASSGAPYLVEHPHHLRDELETRAAARRLWHRIRAEREAAATATDSATFATVYEGLSEIAAANRRDYGMVPIEEAIVVLRAIAASRKAAAATRSRAASGAG